jgi:hypothetical protein
MKTFDRVLIKDQDSKLLECLPLPGRKYITWEVNDDGSPLRSGRNKPKPDPRPKGGRISGDLQVSRREKLAAAIAKHEAMPDRARLEARLLRLAELGRFDWACPEKQEAYERAFGIATEEKIIKSRRERKKRKKQIKQAKGA